jgi:hypothetical protein
VGGHGVRLRTRFHKRGYAHPAWPLIPFLAVAVTGLLAAPPMAGAAVQDVAGIGSFNSVACPSSSLCIGVGLVFATATSAAGGAAAPLAATSGAVPRGQAVQTMHGTELLSGVSCPTVTQCLAVGENSDATGGVAVALDPQTGAVSNGQSVQNIPGILMAAVACPSITQCLAVGHASDGQGVAVSLDPATGAIATDESLETIPGTGGLGLEGLACPTTTQCVAVGENASKSAGAAVPLNPSTGALSTGESVQSVTNKGVLVGISCPSPTRCLAVGWGADQPSVAVPLDPGTGMIPSGEADQTISSRAATLSAVTCPSVSQCLAVGNDDSDPSTGQAVPLSPVTGAISSGQAIESPSGTGALNGIDCSSGTQCLAVGAGFEGSGGASLVLSPTTATGVTPIVPPPPTSAPTTAPVTPTATTVSAPPSVPALGTGPVESRLASTGDNLLLPLALGGVVFVAGGGSLVGVTLRSRRRRNATTAREN